MVLSALLTLCGGLSFFLYGLMVLSEHLRRMAGSRLEDLLRMAASGPARGIALGLAATVALQSSSALTVMLVGLVDAGLLRPGQTVGMIMGSNLGSTVTPWLLLGQGDGATAYLPPLLALSGALLILAGRKQRRRDAGRILMGFAVLLTGMEFMCDALRPLSETEAFPVLLAAFRNPLAGVLSGCLFTAVIQSSAASVGMLQALTMSGSVTYGMALPVVLGQNIGTCSTALLSAPGVGGRARRVAVIHVAFNVAGTAACLLLLYGGRVLFPLAFLNRPASPAGVAVCHSAFNLASVCLLLPFYGPLSELADGYKVRQKRENFSYQEEARAGFR